MDWLESLSLALALGADPFALGLSVGVYCFHPRQMLRMALTVGFFHCFMAIVGWVLGYQLADVIGRIAPWVAFFIIGFFGVKLFIDSLRASDQPMADLPVGYRWYALCFVTSLDALGVGFSLGMLGGNIWLSAVFIGGLTCLMALISMPMSCKISMKVGSRLGMFCGVLMVAIAFKVLLF